MIGTTEKYYSFTPVSVNNAEITLTYDHSLEVKRLIKTNPPYYMDKLDTTYTDTNLNINHVFRNYFENSDGSEKYTSYSGVYLSNIIDNSDEVLSDNFNGLGYISRATEVNLFRI